MILNHNIKLIRELSGMTQEAFAVQLGTKVSNLKSYENTEVSPKMPVLIAVAEFAGISIEDLKGKKLSYGDLKNLVDKGKKDEKDKPIGADSTEQKHIDPEFARYLLENDAWFKNQYAAFNQQVLANLTALQTQTRNLEALLKINLEHTGNIEAHQLGVKSDEVHEQINRDILAAAGVRMDTPAHIPSRG